MAHKELGFHLLKKVEGRLSDLAVPEMPAKMERRALFVILAPQSHFNKKSSKASAHLGAKLKTLSEPSKSPPTAGQKGSSSSVIVEKQSIKNANNQ